MHLIKSQKDFFAGLLFMALGIAFALGARTYNVGTGARMGPGYFPLVLGVVLALLGAGADVVGSGTQGEGNAQRHEQQPRKKVFLTFDQMHTGLLLIISSLHSAWELPVA